MKVCNPADPTHSRQFEYVHISMNLMIRIETTRQNTLTPPFGIATQLS
jgi:hypothetical protein